MGLRYVGFNWLEQNGLCGWAGQVHLEFSEYGGQKLRKGTTYLVQNGTHTLRAGEGLERWESALRNFRLWRWTIVYTKEGDKARMRLLLRRHASPSAAPLRCLLKEQTYIPVPVGA